jgi:DNA polymerase-1
MFPEVQRLVATGPDSLPSDVVVDVSSIDRWLHESSPGSACAHNAGWQIVVDAARRSTRRVLWIVAPPVRHSTHFSDQELSRLRERFDGKHMPGTVVSTKASFAAVLFQAAARLSRTPDIAAVGADISSFPEQVFVLEGPVLRFLDIASGRVLAYANAVRELAEPRFVPLLEALVSPRDGDRRRRPLAGRRAAADRAQLERALLERRPLRESEAAKSTLDAIDASSAEIGTLAARLFATKSPTDPNAREAVCDWLAQPRVTAERHAPPVVMARIDRTDPDRLELTELVVSRDSVDQRVALGTGASIAKAARDLLAELVQKDRSWIAPHGTDLCAWMTDQELELPEAVLDPGVIAFALEPDRPERVRERSRHAAVLSSDAAAWLFDSQREVAAPQHLATLAGTLPSLVDELIVEARARGMRSLVERDLAPTIPILGRIERQGAWVDNPVTHRSWDALRNHLSSELGRLEREYSGITGNLDPYTPDTKALLRRVKWITKGVPKESFVAGLEASSEMARLARHAQHHRSKVVALLRARELAATMRYLELAASRSRLRGIYFPQVTGRFGTKRENLQGFAKHASAALLIREGLKPPPGYRLLAADFTAFEARLLGGLSGDTRLLCAARSADPMIVLANEFFGNDADGRAKIKRLFYPIAYSQGKQGFAGSQPELTPQEIEILHERLSRFFPELFHFRKNIHAAVRTTRQSPPTLSGWRRTFDRADQRSLRAAFSTLVQGAGADILRWVLRSMPAALAGLDAFVVFHSHDEIIVATRPAHEADVERSLKRVMEVDVATSGLVPGGVPLGVKITKGDNWAALV